MSSGSLGLFMLFWGIILIIVAVPLFSYFYGKRWYCSWVCGCGVCASVSPCGVLKLENGKEEGRFGKPILISNNNVQLISDIDYKE